MAGLLRIIPVILLLAFVAGFAYVGYQVCDFRQHLQMLDSRCRVIMR